MEIIGAAALIALGIVVAAIIYGRTHGTARTVAVAHPAPGTAVNPATGTVANPAAGTAVVDARPSNSGRPDAQLLERTAAVTRREETLASREAELDKERAALADARQELERSLEQISGLSAGRAKQLLLKEVEEQAKHDAARRIRQIEEETKRDAERRVRNILSVCMQRLAAGHAAETTVSVVQLS
ncbi:MAG: DUF3552 domain-containing protein, partial [Solirubrobacterales bacterium]|nr:DUF3552 domain-containing protein [Solirubrobacterales bacterium]